MNFCPKMIFGRKATMPAIGEMIWVKDINPIRDLTHPLLGKVVCRKYLIVQKLGNGSFGEVFLAKDKTTGEEVAVKIELKSATHHLLLREHEIYKFVQGVPGIPRVHKCEIEDKHFTMVMDLLGPSLEDVFDSCSRRFTMKTVIMLAEQMITLLEKVHKRHVIHRDLKPDNFLIGTGPNRNKIYLVDFGLSNEYRDYRTLRHIENKKGNKLVGTLRYASLNAHWGLEPSRRDDMESIAYMLIYFFKGSLPWQGVIVGTKKEKYKKVGEMKLSTDYDDLCSGMPFEFSVFLNLCRCMKFEDEPQYDYMRWLFRQVAEVNDIRYDNKFDWILKDKEAEKRRVATLMRAFRVPKVPQGGRVTKLSAVSSSRKGRHGEISFNVPRRFL